jgi:hypothetical protein
MAYRLNEIQQDNQAGDGGEELTVAGGELGKCITTKVWKASAAKDFSGPVWRLAGGFVWLCSSS